ncbi:MAG: 2OG-Fe dioxygenase family protein, partial [Steroidobacterales bacterium]
MHDDFIAVRRASHAYADIVAQGYTRRPLPLDVTIARTLGELAHAAWELPRDQYYETGDRFRSLNRFQAEVAADGVRVQRCDDGEPYVQLEKYNPTLGGRKREYVPLPAPLADAAGIRRLIAHHLMYLPLS